MPVQFLTLYSPCNPLTTGCVLYTASTMSSGTEAPNGYYSYGNDGNCYRVLGSGTIVNVTSCPPQPTPTNPGDEWTLTAFGGQAKFRYQDAADNGLKIIFVSPEASQNVCVRCGTIPVKLSGNGTKTLIGACGTGSC